MKPIYKLLSFGVEILTAYLCILWIQAFHLDLWISLGLLCIAFGGIALMSIIETIGKIREKKEHG
jgi:hypothetical protein